MASWHSAELTIKAIVIGHAALYRIITLSLTRHKVKLSQLMG